MRRDEDELTDIPSMIPERDDVVTHRRNRRQQANQIVKTGSYGEIVKVSTWPVRIMLFLLTCAIAGGAAAAYYAYGIYNDTLRQNELRISDLEGRLALVGESAEDTALNITETLDFHFSEIDKLWAARRSINQGLEDLTSEIAKLGLVNEGQDEATAANSGLIATNTETLTNGIGRINNVSAELERVTQSVTQLNSSMNSLNAMRGDMEAIQATLNSGDNAIGGVVGRLEYVEQSLESVNAHRLQINESLLRLQERIEALQLSQQSGGI